MSYNFINEASIIRTSPLCYYDTVNGYKTNFTVNGEVDGWEYYDGIHTYGCWGGFIFATLYGSYALIGRTSIFYPVPAESHYYVKVVMKIKTVDRVSDQAEPTTARLHWTTTSDSSWNTTKSHEFTIYTDNEWHAYILNMGQYQYWQGDINNLRLYPILNSGRSGDEFFIKEISIASIDTYTCRNSNCSYYSSYEHPCPGIGTKGYCKSQANSSDYYTITEDVNDELIININDYGDETIKLDALSNATGPEIAKGLTKAISKIGIGGYSEVEIDYTEYKEFKIYSGTYTTDSTVVIKDSAAARTLGFFDITGVDVSTKHTGTNPASEAESASTFKIKSFQTLSLFDNDEDTSFYFDPSMYNVEGGRRDWLSGGLGVGNVTIGKDDNTAASNVSQRDYAVIDNSGKTMIDFNHPFNTSGRIRKIYAMCTLDQGYESVSNNPPATDYEGRLEATGCKVLIIRPKRNGNLEIVDSVDIPDRDYSDNRLYSYRQESIDLDCDVWVNKGDLIGIYNANMYTGRSISGEQVDALYYQVSGMPSGEFDPGQLYGDGVSGLLIYARSELKQDQLVLDIDFGSRVNVEDISIIGSVEGTFLEYNIARCVDIDWSVNLFGRYHNTGYKYIGTNPDYSGQNIKFTHKNIAYGIDKLNDGVYIVPDGYAGSDYSVGTSNPYSQGDPVSTFVPTDPQYFFVNGDQEWLGVYQFKKSSTVALPYVENFNDDPIAFVLLFPYGQEKTIFKSAIYFKEKWNFRNFGLSVTYNLDDVLGDAADKRFYYIEEFTAVTMDDFRIEKDGYGYDDVEYYLFNNPNNGEPIFEFSGQREASTGAYYGEISNYIEYTQASNLDWSYLAHEFEPIECKGFMFYCNYHYSTKITEMELFCRVPDIGSNLVGGMSVFYSYYQDLLWQAELEQNSTTEVTAFIGDTPRYFTVQIAPITPTTMKEIKFNINEGDLYVGDKGCETDVLPISAKAGAENSSKIVKLKNIYNSEYDLYVDIAQDSQADERLIYHTKMNNFDSITSPEVGPDSRYYKSSDYPLTGVYRNCAINSECWGLRNLIDGKASYYSYDNGYTWLNYGTLASGVSIDFSNVPNADRSTIILPVLSRNQYWKLVWLADDHPDMYIREMMLFYEGDEVDRTYYHHHQSDWEGRYWYEGKATLAIESGPMNDTAPHLRNDSVTGSYYRLGNQKYIGFDLGAQERIDTINIFHDSMSDYNSTRCGIDKYTKLNLTVKDFTPIDYSYDERPLTISNAEPATGYWDYDRVQVTAVSGIYRSDDSDPTTGSLFSEDTLVDGVYWVPFTTNTDMDGAQWCSVGLDFGTPKQVHELKYYINSYYTSNPPTGTWIGNYGWYVYASNDNYNWTLVQQLTNPVLLWNSDDLRELMFFIYLPTGPTARYLTLWSANARNMAGPNNIYSVSQVEAFKYETNSYRTGIGFKGSTDSYISVPASSDFTFPGYESSFTIDFIVSFDGPPVPSGLDYSTLLRNWPDEVETPYQGTITYPPTFSGCEGVRVGGSQSEAGYAFIMKPEYNLARLSGASYSTSGLAYGSVSEAFDNRCGQESTAMLNGGPPWWIKVVLPEAKKVIKYGIFSYNTSGSGHYPERDAVDFELQCYITASGTWATLHSVIGRQTSYNHASYYSFSNPYDACTDYRLYITSSPGSSYCGIQEFLLFDETEGVTPFDYKLEIWAEVVNPSSNMSGRYFFHMNYLGFEADTTYRIAFHRGLSDNYIDLYINGLEVLYIDWYESYFPLNSSSNDLIIGDNLKGSISDLRITKGIYRTDTIGYYWSPNERYNTLSLYVSDDDITYGKYCDVDLYQDNSHSYYYDDNVFSSDYYTMLAIDLGRRYDIDLIRSYGDSDRHVFSLYGENSTDVYYSNDEISDVNQVTWTPRGEFENEVILQTDNVYGYANYPNACIASVTFTAKDCTGLTKENGVLSIDLATYYTSYVFDPSKQGRIYLSSSGSANSQVWYYVLDKIELQTIAALGVINWFKFYIPLNYFETYNGELDVSAINYIRVYWYPSQSSYSGYCYFRNVKVIWDIADVIEPATDTRWLRFDTLSGDGTDRIIRKLGVYPNVSTQLSPTGGNYNHEWDYLGQSVTAYESSSNLALGATVSGSSYFGTMRLDYLTDGIISSGEDTENAAVNTAFDDVWGSEAEATPWVFVDLGAVYSVYRFKIYHGYDGVDTNYIVTDYQVQTSTDNVTYSTQFTISSNSSFERTHDLALPVQARYVKIAITDYDTVKILLRDSVDDSDSVAFFEGAVMREIEVYEYYGYPIIDSDEYPIIAINMLDQFYLSSHDVVGLDVEDTSDDWSNNDRDFCYSDSVLSDPSKVDFRDWTSDPGYDKWAVVRTDSAENYMAGPNYLKHVRITSSEDQNPCVYPWWWQSSVSTLSRDYSYSLASAISALKIEYPASTTIDEISFIEGDHFDVDELASWRDGFSFRIRIDDINNLDRSFGYFYLGGYDASSGANPITYRWYISTLSGTLTSGWNRMFLRFKQADYIDYVYDSRESDDLRIINTIDLSKIGMRYRGVGNELTMHFDGFRIERNRFYDYSASDVGFYMSNSDYITAPIGEYDMSKGTIEFWMRPDYDYNAADYYGAMRNRAIFCFNNNANDIFGLMFAYNGIELYFGNTVDSLNVLSLSDLGINILDIMFHVGIVFSNDGTQIDSDGSTIRLYFNNELLFKSTETWEVYDNKHFTFILGGTAPLNLKAGTYLETTAVDAVISDFKLYNYCKKDFYNSIRNLEDTADNLIKPSNFIEISKDNLTYYKVGATQLPLVFQNVAPNVTVPIYVRVNTPDDLTGKESRTAGLLCYWDISV